MWTKDNGMYIGTGSQDEKYIQQLLRNNRKVHNIGLCTADMHKLAYLKIKNIIIIIIDLIIITSLSPCNIGTINPLSFSF